MKHFISGLTKLTVASALVVTLAACGGADERKAKYLEKGKTYLEEQNYKKAKIEFKNVLQIDPKFAEAYYFMGQLEEKNKELGKALNNYRKAIDLDPLHVKAKVKLSKIYVIAGTQAYIDKANKLLAEVKKVEPDNTEAEFISATIKYKTGLKLEGVADLEKVVAKDGHLAEGISLLATFYTAQGENEKAKKLLIKGTQDNPDNIPLRITLARLLAKNNDLAGAEKYLKQALDIKPDTYSLQVALASFYATSNQLDKAEDLLRKAIKQDEDDAKRYLVLVELLSSRFSLARGDEELKKAIQNKPDLYELKFAQIEFYEKVGKRDEAKEALENIISEKSYEVEGVRARAKIAKLMLEEGDQASAKKYANEILAEYPNNNDALLITSKLAILNADAISAINGLRTVVKNDPKNAEASLLLAQAHEINGESSLAENELKKAIEANPINDQVHVNYAKYLGSKGRIDEAVDVVDKALTYFKDSYALMSIKLKVLASEGKGNEVLVLLDMMESVDATKAEVNINRGKYYLSINKMQSAIDEFEKAYNKSRNKFESLQLISKTYMLNKQSDEALARLQKSLDKNPADAAANFLIGQVYTVQKKIPEARNSYLKAIETAESWVLPYSGLATTYLVENNLDKALSVYQDALSKLKNKVVVQLKIASIYEQKKDFANAISVYKDILSENEGNQLAANNYASLLLDYGKDSDAAKALELAMGFEKVQQPALQDTLAWAYAKNGNNIKAVEILKPIVEKAPKIGVFRYHLGYALYQTGDKDAAKSHLKIAVASKQDFAGKDKAEALLKSI